jgi:IPT/TIG domain-containing protein
MTVSPTSGSTAGGTTITITGSGFLAGLTVTLGGERQAVEVPSSTSILMTTAAHDPGPVAIVVANPNGQTATLSGGYSYASPQSFDFNGTWEGFAAAHPDHPGPTRHSDMDMRFTIERNVLTSFTCGGATLAFSSQLVVSDGAFTHAGDGEAVMSGRIVAEGISVGTIDTDACPATRWVATRR